MARRLVFELLLLILLDSHREARHPNIVLYIALSRSPPPDNVIYIISEFVENGKDSVSIPYTVYPEHLGILQEICANTSGTRQGHFPGDFAYHSLRTLHELWHISTLANAFIGI